MFKVVALLAKKPGLSTNQLIEYYERQHVPLVISLAPAPMSYRRNYVVSDNTAGDFDIITELTFPDQAAYESWVAVMYAPGSGVTEDERNFLDRSRTRSFTVEERVTA
ncbi:EthD domain-containing protein [Nocardia otitidiscaviarum]|uniref:EthD domain-containing protein n=1 Tax=Nocardia otitidiscaviarum TaxID=1823 RepID=UPI0004A7842D|nr:EthD domain-containing protein [Nocardia otitidiscaviarum]MBF6132094.1 EthD domain-containing protein [Nocardia otitidiscaviarum]MBF6483224.1 EthD domain-containing protein [Nocardia otitidiscaviarum]